MLNREWMLTPGATLRIPAAPARSAMLGALNATVPGRGRGRENWHRERYCIVALLRWLARHRSVMFPASLVRGQAPDFVLEPKGVPGPLAVEHTDIGDQAYHRRLDASAAPGAPRIMHFDVPDDPAGDLPERSLANDIQAGLRRKSTPKVWRNSPSGAARWFLLYDNSEMGRWVDQQAAKALLTTALRDHRPTSSLDAVALVRGRASVLVVDGERSSV